MKIDKHVLIRETLISNKQLEKLTGRNSQYKLYVEICTLRNSLIIVRQKILENLEQEIGVEIDKKNFKKANNLIKVRREIFNNKKIKGEILLEYELYNEIFLKLDCLSNRFLNHQNEHTFKLSRVLEKKIGTSFLLKGAEEYKSWQRRDTRRNKSFSKTLHSTLYRAAYKTIPLNYLCSAQIIELPTCENSHPTKKIDYKLNKLFFQEVFEYFLKFHPEIINYMPFSVNQYKLTKKRIQFYAIKRTGYKYHDVFNEVNIDKELESILSYFKVNKTLLNVNVNFCVDELRFWYSGGLLSNNFFSCLNDELWCSKWLRYYRLNHITIPEEFREFLIQIENVQREISRLEELSHKTLLRLLSSMMLSIMKLNGGKNLPSEVLTSQRLITMDEYKESGIKSNKQISAINESILKVKPIIDFLATSLPHNAKYKSIVEYFYKLNKKEVRFLDFYRNYHKSKPNLKKYYEEVSYSFSEKYAYLKTTIKKRAKYLSISPSDRKLKEISQLNVVRPLLNGSYNIFFKFEKSTPVLNAISPGNGRMFSRFLKNYPQIISSFERSNSDLESQLFESLLIENIETCNFNYNDRPRLFKYSLDIPGSIDNRKCKVRLENLVIKFEENFNRLVIYDDVLKKNIFLNDTNFHSFELRSNLIDFLLTLSNQSFFGFEYLTNKLHLDNCIKLEEGIFFYPEIRLKDKLILKLSTLVLHKQKLFDFKGNLIELIDFWKKHEIPEKVQFCIREERGERTGFVDIFDSTSISNLLNNLKYSKNEFVELHDFAYSKGKQKEYLVQLNVNLNE